MQETQSNLSCVEYRRSVTYFAKNHYFFIAVEAFKICSSFRIAVHENILSSLSLSPKTDESVSFQLLMPASQQAINIITSPHFVATGPISITTNENRIETDHCSLMSMYFLDGFSSQLPFPFLYLSSSSPN